MLIRKLKLPGYTFVTKILYSFMGLLSTFLSVLKMIYDQPILVEIQVDKSKSENKNESKLEALETAKRVRINRSGTLNILWYLFLTWVIKYKIHKYIISKPISYRFHPVWSSIPDAGLPWLFLLKLSRLRCHHAEPQSNPSTENSTASQLLNRTFLRGARDQISSILLVSGNR